MIDEELYMIATEELNSDNKREDIWARAIALASDDHDEARYLYTNLRVEELVKERKAGGGVPAEPASVPGTAERLDTATEDDLDFDALTQSSADDTASAVSRMQRKAEELNNELRGRQQGAVPVGQGVEDLDVDEFGDSTLESEPLQPDQTGLFTEAVGTMQHDSTSLNDELDPLERTEPEGFDLSDNSLEMTSPENLAQVLPAESYAAATETMQFDNTRGFANQTSAPPVFEDKTSPATTTTETIDRFDATIEPPVLSGRAFSVVRHDDGSRKAVKIGKSWPALLFTLPWLLYKRLWGTALVYLLMAAALVFALVSTGFSLADAGEQASLQQKLVFAAFALLAVIGMLYIPFRQGNQWVIQRLLRKGYRHHSDLNAQSARDALDLARE